jgi:RNA polymerase II subunit A C-terminal domain phosphatase
MIHSVPDLKVSEELAKKLGRKDTDRLLNDRKLVLLVDLDQTLIHTTNDNSINKLNYSRMFIIFNFMVHHHLGIIHV